MRGEPRVGSKSRSAADTPLEIPSLLELLLRALLAALLGRAARRTRRISWHYNPITPSSPGAEDGCGYDPTTGFIPRRLRRGSPDIIIAQAHGSPRRARARPAPRILPLTAAARAPPRPPRPEKCPAKGSALPHLTCCDIVIFPGDSG